MKKSTISYPDFDKLDLLVGEVKEASLVEKSKHLIKLLIDLGAEYGEVVIMSGLSPTYTPEDLKGKKFIVLANLEPKQMMGLSSQGMILVADDPEKFQLVPLDNNLKNGTVIR